GEDRITVTREAGTLRVVGVSDTDDSPPARVEVDLGPAETGRRLRVTIGALSGTVERQGGKAHLAARARAFPPDRDEPPADDELLAGPTLAPDVVYQRRLAGLAVGGAADLKLVNLSIAPALALERMALHVVRQADEERTVAGRRIPVRVYAIDAGAQKWQL